ncbi:hypothetical protein BKA62DRAFT_39721 [Auriculariales sp. MPI-PUGE-AT-0066]|nr:hypothetical protein BKA62DRAFT_39721 [Auriculariales sp. MPI-PUGE-AT-0066]
MARVALLSWDWAENPHAAPENIHSRLASYGNLEIPPVPTPLMINFLAMCRSRLEIMVESKVRLYLRPSGFFHFDDIPGLRDDLLAEATSCKTIRFGENSGLICLVNLPLLRPVMVTLAAWFRVWDVIGGTWNDSLRDLELPPIWVAGNETAPDNLHFSRLKALRCLTPRSMGYFKTNARFPSLREINFVLPTTHPKEALDCVQAFVHGGLPKLQSLVVSADHGCELGGVMAGRVVAEIICHSPQLRYLRFVQITGLCLEWILQRWALLGSPSTVSRIYFDKCTLIAVTLTAFARWRYQLDSKGFDYLETTDCVLVDASGSLDGSLEAWEDAGEDSEAYRTASLTETYEELTKWVKQVDYPFWMESL